MNQPVTTTQPVRIRRRTSEEVSSLLSSYEQSNLSLRAFCHQHQLAPSTFSGLLRRHRQLKRPPLSQPDSASCSLIEAISLAPVDIVDACDNSQPKGSPLVVELSRGVRIAVDRHFDEATLLRLVAVLGKE
jgi:hypothetical protein